MAKLKLGVGFHTGVPCLCNGIGDYLKNLANGDHVITAKCNDGTSSLMDFQREIQTGAEGYGIYRTLMGDDVPPYGHNVQDVAQAYYSKIVANFPSELDKELFYVECMNEVDKNHSNWIGELLCEIAELMLADGRRFCGPGWSTGEPELEHWETPGMLKWLQMCADNKGELAISLHEYSLTDELSTKIDYLMGRVTWMNSVCDYHFIPWPDVFVSEFGWMYRDAPSWQNGVPQIIDMVKWYIKYAPNVKALHIWALDSGDAWGDLNKTINPYMTPLAATINATDWEEPIVPDPVEKIKFVEYLYPQEMEKDQYFRVANRAWKDYKRSMGGSVDHAMSVMQSETASDESYVVVWNPDQPSQQRAIDALHNAGITYETRYLDQPEDRFPETISLGHLFRWRYVLTSPFNAPRGYANGFHEGVDYDIIGGKPDNTVSVLCAYPGVVDSARLGRAYGLRVRVRHELDGHVFYTWYCHLDEIHVEEGDVLLMGSDVGELGDTGKNPDGSSSVTGEHIHFNLAIPGYGLSGYAIDDVVDPLPYLPDPSGLPLYVNVEPKGYRVLDYILPVSTGNGRMYEVQHASGHTETFQVQVSMRIGNQVWFELVKNSQYESFYSDGQYIWRYVDTSPGSSKYAERPGEPRWYTQYEAGKDMARWCMEYMQVGQQYVGPGHTVHYAYKSDCAPSQLYSGPATNMVTLAKHYNSLPFHNGIVLEDLIGMQTNTGELMIFARGYGLVAWRNSSGQESAISEILSGRPSLVKEAGCFTQ